jgi:O-antigen ligase
MTYNLKTKRTIFYYILSFLGIMGVSIVFHEMVDYLLERYSFVFGLFSSSFQSSGLESVRLELAINAWYQFLENPFWGYGACSSEHFGLYYTAKTSNHLGLLNILGEFGIIGTSVLGLLFYIAVKKTLKANKILRIVENEDRNLGYLFLSFMIFNLAQGFFRDPRLINIIIFMIAFSSCINQLWKEKIIKNRVDVSFKSVTNLC